MTEEVRKALENMVREFGVRYVLTRIADILDNAGKPYVAGRLDQLRETLEERGYD